MQSERCGFCIEKETSGNEEHEMQCMYTCIILRIRYQMGEKKPPFNAATKKKQEESQNESTKLIFKMY